MVPRVSGAHANDEILFNFLLRISKSTTARENVIKTSISSRGGSSWSPAKLQRSRLLPCSAVGGKAGIRSLHRTDLLQYNLHFPAFRRLRVAFCSCSPTENDVKGVANGVPLKLTELHRTHGQYGVLCTLSLGCSCDVVTVLDV